MNDSYITLWAYVKLSLFLSHLKADPASYISQTFNADSTIAL